MSSALPDTKEIANILGKESNENVVWDPEICISGSAGPEPRQVTAWLPPSVSSFEKQGLPDILCTHMVAGMISRVISIKNLLAPCRFPGMQLCVVGTGIEQAPRQLAGFPG